MSATTVDEVRALVASPGLTDQAKRELLESYLAAEPRAADDELLADADRLGASPQIGGLPLGRVAQLPDRLAQAHQQVQDWQSQQGRQALQGAGLGAAGSNEILDHGAAGLRYFEHFAPLYRRCVAGSDVSRDRAVQLYDEQRDIDLAALRADSTAVTSAATRLGTELSEQRDAWDAVAGIWTGRGAAAADAHVRTYLAEADGARGRAADLGAVLGPAADGLEECVRARAGAVAELYATTVGGRTPSEIDEIISFALDSHTVSSVPQAVRILQMFGQGAGPTTGDVGDAVGTALGEALSGSIFSTARALLGQGADYLQRLLEEAVRCSRDFVAQVFVPDVESRWRVLTEVCSTTDTAVREIYQGVTAVAATAQGHPFSSTPGTLPALPGPGGAVSSGPAAGVPGAAGLGGSGGPDGFVGAGRLPSEVDDWDRKMGSRTFWPGGRAAMPIDGLLSLGEAGGTGAAGAAGSSAPSEVGRVGGVASAGAAADPAPATAPPPEDEVGQVRATSAGSGGGAADGASGGDHAGSPVRGDAGPGGGGATGTSDAGGHAGPDAWLGSSAPMSTLHQGELAEPSSADQWVVENPREDGAWTSLGSALTGGPDSAARESSERP